MTLNITTPCIRTFRILTLSKMTIGITTHSIVTLSNVTICRKTFRITTGSVKHNMLSVILLNAAMVSVVAPLKWVLKSYFFAKLFWRCDLRSINSPGNTKRGSVTILLTSCLNGLDQSAQQIKTKIVSNHTADSKPVKQEVYGTVILPLLVFPEQSLHLMVTINGDMNTAKIVYGVHSIVYRVSLFIIEI